MGTIRLGKRTEGRSPLIKDFVPLASLDDLVFGGWDIFDDNCYEAAKTAGVLAPDLLEQIRPELEAIRPWPAVFDRHYVKRLDGPNVKKGKNKKDLAEQLRRRHPPLQGRAAARSAGDGVVRQHRDLPDRVAAPMQTSQRSRRRSKQNDPSIPSSMIYAYAAIKEGIPYANAAPNLSARRAGAAASSPARRRRRSPARTSRPGRR